MYESSGSPFFRNTTGIKSGPEIFAESRFVINFLNILEVAEILCSFRLVREGKAGKEIPESSMIRVLRFFANNFALSDAEHNTFGRFNRGAFADLPLLRTLLTFHQKSQEPTFGEVMVSVLLTYAIFAASSTLLQKSIACLKVTLQKIYSTGTNKKNDFYQL